MIKSMKHSNREYLKGYAIMALMILLILLFVVWIFQYLFPGLLPLLMTRDDEAIADYIRSEGLWRGRFCVYILCIMQVVSIVIPSLPIHVAVGSIYGWWKSSILCYLGFVSGNALVFNAARRLGERVERFVPGIKDENWLTRKINTENPAVVVALACMIPGVPNGMIPYVASRTQMTQREYTKAIALSSWLQVLINCCCGHFLMQGDYIVAISMFLLQMVIIAILFWKRDKILVFFTKKSD